MPLPSAGSWQRLPQQDSTLCQPLYFCYTLSDPLYPSEPGHIKISSQNQKMQKKKKKGENNHPCFRLMLISLPSGEATWDKAQATLDTSNQWNPQGLRWVFNEVHCSQPESPSPRDGLTSGLLFGFCLVDSALSNWSAPAQSCLPDAPFVFVAGATAASHSIMKQRSIISL